MTIRDKLKEILLEPYMTDGSSGIEYGKGIVLDEWADYKIKQILKVMEEKKDEPKIK